MRTPPGQGATLFDARHLELHVRARGEVDAPRVIDLTIESRIDEPVGVAQLRLLNRQTGVYDLVGQHALIDADRTATVRGIDAGLYANAAGEVELSIKHFVFGPGGPFTSFFDRVAITVR